MKHPELSDAELLRPILREEDKNADYITANNTYGYYYGIAHLFRPKYIGEIGVGYGYSLFAMVLGAGRSDVFAAGWDNEVTSPGGIAHTLAGIRQFCECCRFYNTDTQTQNHIDFEIYDLFHVDGDHTEAGCAHDLDLAWESLKDGGVLLVDDFDYIAQVRGSVRRFAEKHCVEWFYLPTYRGLAIIRKP